jgi:hypothetical protein
LPDLDGHFLVKSVVECKHLKLTTWRTGDESKSLRGGGSSSPVDGELC